MAPAFTTGRRMLASAVAGGMLVFSLAGCVGDGEDAPSTLTIGTTERVSSIDPAGAYDNGSFAVMNQVYPFLMNAPAGQSDVEPDIAVSAEFTTPTTYTVILKPDLVFANGNALTASDVQFSFERQLEIDDPNGPSLLLYNLDSVDAPDDTTVVFHLKSENDQVFPFILSSPAGPIVDEEVFAADSIMLDEEIVDGNPFAGPFTISNYDADTLIEYEANPGYEGLLGAAETDIVRVRYYVDSLNLKLDVAEGNVDVAYRTLSPAEIGELRDDENVRVVDGPGGEIRYIVFNLNTMPFGQSTSEPDPAKALAVRQAIAHLLDRDAIADGVYEGTFSPLYSFVPEGLTGATESLKDLYGDGAGAPDVQKATDVLTAAGITPPLPLRIQYVNDRYGPLSGEEYEVIAESLESSGLFEVRLDSADWEDYSAARVGDRYPIYQLGWFPDYSDADNYLTPFFLSENFLANHYSDPAVDELVLEQAVTADADARTALIQQVQDAVAAALPTLPYLQGSQTVVAGVDVSGVEAALGPSLTFRYGSLAKE